MADPQGEALKAERTRLDAEARQLKTAFIVLDVHDPAAVQRHIELTKRHIVQSAAFRVALASYERDHGALDG